MSSTLAPSLSMHNALMPVSAAPVPLFSREASYTADSYVDALRKMEVEAGPYAVEMAEPLLALGRLYQQQNEHELAIAEFDRARHISRVNYGLDSEAQFPAIELSIASYLALHNYAEAVDQQEMLVAMHKSRFGAEAVELVPRLLTLGDMYFAAFERGVQQQGVGLNLEYGAESNYRDPAEFTAKELAFLWLQQAQITYMGGITILLKQQDLQNPQLPRLEANVVETLFLLSHREELEVEPEFFLGAADSIRPRGKAQWRFEDEDKPLYQEGEVAFKRMLFYLQRSPTASPLQIATVMLQLGDWHFLFNRYPKGRAIYKEAKQYLEQEGVEAAAIAALLAPEVPVQLPTFMGQPHSRARLAAQGHEP
ncbi:MAG: tetratricopeptide repeat protein, partial [Pseudomonadota bacterium]